MWRISIILAIFILMLIPITSGQMSEISKEHPKETITFGNTWKEICSQKSCTRTLYSGVKYVYENNEWKGIRDADSLLGYYNMVFNESDPDFKIEIVDFNYYNIYFELVFNGDYAEYEYEEDEGKIKLKLKFTSMNFNETIDSWDDTEYEVELESDKNFKTNLLYTGEPILDNMFRFGGESTTIYLRDDVTENLGDSDFDEDSITQRDELNYNTLDRLDGTGEMFWIKWNISSIPSGQVVEEAEMNIYISNSVTADILDVYSSNNETTEEEDVDFICNGNNNHIACEQLWNQFEDFQDTVGGFGWQIINVTNGVQTKYDNGNSSISFWFNHTGDVTDYGYVYTRDYTESYRPMLNITYTEAGGGDVLYPTWSQNSTNNTIAGGYTKHSVYWTDDTEVDGCIFSFCNGMFNESESKCGYMSNSSGTVDDGQSCDGFWGFDCGATCDIPEGNNTFHCVNCVGGSADEHVDNVYLNATNISAGHHISWTCEFDPYSSATEEYMWLGFPNGSFYNYYTENAVNGNIHNVTKVINPSTPGRYITRCSTNYIGSGTPCQTGSYIDNDDLQFWVLSDGTWINEWVNDSFIDVMNWFNVSKTINTTQGVNIAWENWCNDTSDNWNNTGVFNYTTSTDNPPTWSQNSTNGTNASAYIDHRVYWEDDNGLSGYVFEFCNGYWNGTECKRKQVNISVIDPYGDWSQYYRYHLGTYDDDIEHCVLGKYNYSGEHYFYKCFANWNITEYHGKILKNATLIIEYEADLDDSNSTFVYVYSNHSWDYLQQDCNSPAEAETCWKNTYPEYATLLGNWSTVTTASQYDLYFIDITEDLQSAIDIQDSKYVLMFDSQYGNDTTEYGDFRYVEIGSSEHITPPDYQEQNFIRIEVETWENDSWSSLTGTGNWTNVSKYANSTVGSTVAWRVYGNDTSDNWNATSIFTYVTTSGAVGDCWVDIGKVRYVPDGCVYYEPQEEYI